MIKPIVISVLYKIPLRARQVVYVGKAVRRSVAVFGRELLFSMYMGKHKLCVHSLVVAAL